MAAIEVRDLQKTYGDVRAVHGLDLEVAEGEVFALLGPNGAGKTTTVEILEGHRMRDGGAVSVLGVDPADAGRDFRERIGIVLQSAGIERELTVREAINFYGRIYPRRLDVDRVIEVVGLEEKADARVKTLSGGQQRRIDLALGLVGDPDLLFLDEPTTGFDPSARRRSWELVERLRSLGKTILLTTHYMDEAQHLADRVAVIARGEKLAEGTPETLGGRQLAATVITFRPPPGFDGAGLDTAVVTADEMVTVRTAEPTAALHRLTAWALDRGVELENLTVQRPTLEDIYLELTDDDG